MEKNIKTDHIVSARLVGGNCFRLIYVRKSNTPLSFYLSKFNSEDYYIYKSTLRFREVSVEEFLSFKNAGYIFFKKDAFDKNNIDKWVKFTNDVGSIKYLSRPFPPFEPENLIEIR